MVAFATSIQCVTGNARQSSKARKEVNGIQIRKKEVKSFLFTGEIILCVENPKESSKSLSELTNSAMFQDTKSTCKIQVYF